MKGQFFSKKLCAALVGAVFACTATFALAVEDAAGVKVFVGRSLEGAKIALEHAKQGHKDETLAALKMVRQTTKEITGDAAGPKLQRANSGIKAAMNAADKDDMAKATEELTGAVKELEEINAAVK